MEVVDSFKSISSTLAGGSVSQSSTESSDGMPESSADWTSISTTVAHNLLRSSASNGGISGKYLGSRWNPI